MNAQNRSIQGVLMRKTHRTIPRRLATLAASLVLLFAWPVLAQPKKEPPRADPLRPKVVKKQKRTMVELPKKIRDYEEKTPTARREEARKLFHRANKRFEQRRVDDAIRLYRRAYKLWPHPRILFNIAVSLGFLSQPQESAWTFKQVLEYGPEPITPERYKQAQERYIELMGQLAILQITCEDPGAKIYVDGREVGTAPVNTKVTLGPGTHMISANLKGKVPFTAQVRLEPGGRKAIKVSLQAFQDVVRYRMVARYHWYVPTIVTTAAAVAAAVGTSILMIGRDDVGNLQQDVNGIIRDRVNDYDTFTYDVRREDKDIQLQKGGWALLGTAGAAAVAAVVLWIVRKKRVRYTLTETKTVASKIEF